MISRAAAAAAEFSNVFRILIGNQVELALESSNMLRSLCSGQNRSCRVLNERHMFDALLSESTEKAIRIVESTGDKKLE